MLPNSHRFIIDALIVVAFIVVGGCREHVLTTGTEGSAFTRDSTKVERQAIPIGETGNIIYGLNAPLSADESFADSVLKIIVARGIRPTDAWFPEATSYMCGACCIPPSLCVRLAVDDRRITELGFSDSTGASPCFFLWYHYTFRQQ